MYRELELYNQFKVYLTAGLSEQVEILTSYKLPNITLWEIGKVTYSLIQEFRKLKEEVRKGHVVLSLEDIEMLANTTRLDIYKLVGGLIGRSPRTVEQYLRVFRFFKDKDIDINLFSKLPFECFVRAITNPDTWETILRVQENSIEESRQLLLQRIFLMTPITLSIRYDIMKRDNFRCCICGRGVKDGTRLEVDHIVPKSKGGTNDPDNLSTLCYECNRGKMAKLE